MEEEHKITVKVLEITNGIVQSGKSEGTPYIKVKWEQNGKEFTKTCFDTMHIAAFKLGLEVGATVDVTLSPDWKKIQNAVVAEPINKEQAVNEPVGKSVPAKDDIAPQAIGMWFKHKAFSLSYTKDLVCNGVIEMKDLYKCAEEMLDWLNKKMV